MASWLLRRRNYLINKDFQFRYIGKILYGVALMALIVFSTVYYTTWSRIMDEFYTIPRIAAQFATLFGSVNQTMLVILVLFLLLAAVISVFVSHSIAGPVYRFEKTLQSIAQGDLTLRVGLRKTDEFKNLADAMNHMVDELRTHLTSDTSLIEEMAKISERLHAKGKGEGKLSQETAKDLEKLNQALQNLQKNVSRYKLKNQ